MLRGWWPGGESWLQSSGAFEWHALNHLGVQRSRPCNRTMQPFFCAVLVSLCRTLITPLRNGRSRRVTPRHGHQSWRGILGWKESLRYKIGFLEARLHLGRKTFGRHVYSCLFADEGNRVYVTGFQFLLRVWHTKARGRKPSSELSNQNTLKSTRWAVYGRRQGFWRKTSSWYRYRKARNERRHRPKVQRHLTIRVTATTHTRKANMHQNRSMNLPGNAAITIRWISLGY